MPPPNIVWLTLDSLRADRTIMEGHDPETADELEERVSDWLEDEGAPVAPRSGEFSEGMQRQLEDPGYV